MILFHRGHEHSGRLQHIVDELDLPDIAMFAWDARGHGYSGGPPATLPSPTTVLRDIDTMVELLRSFADSMSAHLGEAQDESTSNLVPASAGE